MTDDEALWATYWSEPTDANRNAIVERYRPLAISLATRTGIPEPMRSVVDYGDLICAALEALTKTVPRYRPECGQFAVFAYGRLVGAVRDELRDLSWRRNCGRPGGGKRRTVTASGPQRVLSSLDAHPGAYSQTADTSAPDHAAVLADRLGARQIISEALESLPARNRQVVEMIYYDGLTLAEIGRRFGVTEAGACQIHRRALVLLRRVVPAMVA